MLMRAPDKGRKLRRTLDAVVKLFVVSDPPDYDQPWQTEGADHNVGSGAVVETARGPRILTNAHCVENRVFVEVRRYGLAEKVVARVEAVSHECDLALLSAPTSFFEGIQPIPLGPLPELGDPVELIGYPVGGDRLSVTRGLVSRVDLVEYTQSQRRLLTVQIDAAINNGASGGPVIRDGFLVGVAFQAMDDADRVGHAIAPEVVAHFLRDVDAGLDHGPGGIVGFPALGALIQVLESPAHRRYLGLSDSERRGVLVTRVLHRGSAEGVLRSGDVLLEIDGVPVAPDGTVPLRLGERVGMEWAIACRFLGEVVPLTVLREGSELRLEVTMSPPACLVAEDRYDVPPSYYIFGGLLFVPLTRDYLKTWGEQWWHSAPHELVALYENGIRTPELREPVVLQKVLADRVNQGYHDYESVLITRVQGIAVRSLSHLVAIVDEGEEPFVVFEAYDGRQIVLERVRVDESHDEILDRFGVNEDRSVDLLQDDPEPAELDRNVA